MLRKYSWFVFIFCFFLRHFSANNKQIF